MGGRRGETRDDENCVPLHITPSTAHDRHMARPRHTEFAGRRAKEFRNDMTISEARLWSAIKGGQAGARFRRQVPIGRWIADFACFQPRLVVEVDDLSHDFRDDTERDADLASEGFSILRLDNKDIAMDLDASFNSVVYWIEHMREHGRPPE